jgi:cytochrome c553
MRSVLVFVVAVVLAGCGKKEDAPDEGGRPTTVEPEGSGGGATSGNKAAFEARNVFQTICATCHGAGGKGDGQASAMLNPKPRNYTDKAWQAEVTDEDIKKIILLGGQALGKSAVMPAQPQLRDKPEVVDELVKIIRGFAGT